MVRTKSLGAPSTLRPTVEEPVAHRLRGNGHNICNTGLLAEELHGRSVAPNGVLRIATEMPRLFAKALSKNFDLHMILKRCCSRLQHLFENFMRPVPGGNWCWEMASLVFLRIRITFCPPGRNRTCDHLLKREALDGEVPPLPAFRRLVTRKVTLERCVRSRDRDEQFSTPTKREAWRSLM